MLFVADQHHLGDLERKVIKPHYQREVFRLMGDISPSHMNKRTTTLLKTLQNEYKRIKGGRSTDELSYVEKLRAHEEGVREAYEHNPKRALELTTMYAGASIANLVRKYFVNAHSREKTLCLLGNEVLMHIVQRQIHGILVRKNNLKQDRVMRYVLKTIQRKNPKMMSLLERLLKESGIKDPFTEFVLSQLAVGNYKDKLPTCLDVFKGPPYLPNFEFVETIRAEEAGSCVIVHVPFFYGEEQRVAAINYANTGLDAYLRNRTGIPIVAYHGNPDASKMKDKKARRRIDYNKIVIEAVVNRILETPNLDFSRGVKVICAHLHKSNKRYPWSKYGGIVDLYPLGIDNVAFLNTASGKLKVEKY
jgi:hypothetical protein